MQGRVLFHCRVGTRLCETRLVEFIVAIAAVANKIDDDASPRAALPRVRNARNRGGRNWIVAVHVENRNSVRFADIRGVERRAPFAGKRSKADLVVDDEMYDAAGVSRDPVELDQLAYQTLSRESCVGVHK